MLIQLSMCVLLVSLIKFCCDLTRWKITQIFVWPHSFFATGKFKYLWIWLHKIQALSKKKRFWRWRAIRNQRKQNAFFCWHICFNCLACLMHSTEFRLLFDPALCYNSIFNCEWMDRRRKEKHLKKVIILCAFRRRLCAKLTLILSLLWG